MAGTRKGTPCSIHFAIMPQDLAVLALEINEASLPTKGRVRKELQFKIPPAQIATIATDLTGAFSVFVGTRKNQRCEETPAQTAQWARRLAGVASKMLTMLDYDCRGPDGTIVPYVPIPSRLTNYPAHMPPKGFMSPNELEDDARKAMLNEVGGHIERPSIFGAHDVARMTVAAVRQLRRLAEARAENAESIRLHRTDWAAISLFRSVADAFTKLYGAKYTVSNPGKVPAGNSRLSMPSGQAMDWTLQLFDLAANRAVGTPLHQELSDFAGELHSKPDALAGRIREATRSRVKRQQRYSR